MVDLLVWYLDGNLATRKPADAHHRPAFVDIALGLIYRLLRFGNSFLLLVCARRRPRRNHFLNVNAVWSADDWYKNTLVEGDDTAKLAGDELEPAEALEPTA